VHFCWAVSESNCSGAKSGLYKDIWYVLILYAFVSALPTILSTSVICRRRRMLILQMEVDIDILNAGRYRYCQLRRPKFQDLLQRTFRNGPSPLHELQIAQITAIGRVASFILGTFCCTF